VNRDQRTRERLRQQVGCGLTLDATDQVRQHERVVALEELAEGVGLAAARRAHQLLVRTNHQTA
jgi:hypothetical protein